MHEVLVNRLGGLSLPRKSVVRLTDRPDMTLDFYRGRKTTIQQQHRPPLRLEYISVSVVLECTCKLHGQNCKSYFSRLRNLNYNMSSMFAVWWPYVCLPAHPNGHTCIFSSVVIATTISNWLKNENHHVIILCSNSRIRRNSCLSTNTATKTVALFGTTVHVNCFDFYLLNC